MSSQPASFELQWLAAQAPGAHAAIDPSCACSHWLEGGHAGCAARLRLGDAGRTDGCTAARLDWLTRLVQDGLAFLRGVPATENALLEAMPLIGRVLETNYGLTFDVRSVPQPENLAYSDLGLGLHTDNPYREPVPGFQALHALITSNEGGDSLFADGLALAEHLRATAPEAFAQPHHDAGAVPVSVEGCGAVRRASPHPADRQRPGQRGALQQPLDRPARPAGAADARRFYAAYRRFAALMREARFPAAHAPATPASSWCSTTSAYCTGARRFPRRD